MGDEEVQGLEWTERLNPFNIRLCYIDKEG